MYDVKHSSINEGISLSELYSMYIEENDKYDETMESIKAKIDLWICIGINIVVSNNSNDKANDITITIKMNEKILNEANESTINFKYPNNWALLDYHGFDISTIQDWYEVKMRHIKINGKMGLL